MNTTPLSHAHTRAALPLGAETTDTERLLAGVLEAVENLTAHAPGPRPSIARDPSDRTPTLLRLLTYCYATGLFASSEIETRLHSDPLLRYLAGGERLESGSLRGFRRRHQGAVQRCLARTLQSSWGGTVPEPSREPHSPVPYAEDSLSRWCPRPARPDFEAEAADRIRRAVCDDTALLDE